MWQSSMTEQLLKTFILFFVVIEPISMVPLFGALTRGAEPGYRRRMALPRSTRNRALPLPYNDFRGNWSSKGTNFYTGGLGPAAGIISV